MLVFEHRLAEWDSCLGVGSPTFEYRRRSYAASSMAHEHVSPTPKKPNPNPPVLRMQFLLAKKSTASTRRGFVHALRFGVSGTYPEP